MNIEDIFYISEKDWYTLQAWATIAYEEDKNEISGLMTAIPQKDGRIEVGNVEILKQENTGTNTELDGEAVSEYMMKYAMKYKDKNMKFVWWHSHHTMGAFWSGTDEREIDAWKNESYSLALVINLKEEYLFRVSFWKHNGLPMEKHIDTTLNIEREKPLINITKKMKKDYNELCTSPQIVNYNQGWTRPNWAMNQNTFNFVNDKTRVTTNVREAYEQCLGECEKMQESFLDGTLTCKEFKKKVKNINKVCKEKKFPFNVKEFNLNKNELLNKLLELFPTDFIEYEDNNVKLELEPHGGYLWT